jgi:hypothetical protein
VLPQPPATEARLDAKTNLEESDRYRDEKSPKFSFVVVLIRPKSDTWFLLFTKVLWVEWTGRLPWRGQCHDLPRRKTS